MHIHGYTGELPLPILREAILLVSPAVRVAMHKKGAKTIAMPMALNEKQRTRFGVEWILKASDKKPGNVEVRLAKEFIAVVRGNSEALKKREETHRFAMLNRYVLFYAYTGKFLILLRCSDEGAMRYVAVVEGDGLTTITCPPFDLS